MWLLKPNLCIAIFFLSTATFASGKDAYSSIFDPDSVYGNLEYLVKNIGPRTMGSLNERKALDWVAGKFKAFNADSSYVMPVPYSNSSNTNSGIAIGVFKGTSDSTIVIGAHIDSDSFENPGANDDASGVAVMLELAKIWSRQSHHYTLLFAAFGGEEKGLVGSYWFVDHYESLADVVLMLQVDMAGYDGPVIPFFEAGMHQAPKWLVDDAFTIDRGLGYNNLEYPTHFFSLNSIGSGLVGSDHQPFLQQGIPAIDFTNGITTSPIHTPSDNLKFISKDALVRICYLINGLLEKYNNQGIPSVRSGNYLVWRVFDSVLFIPQWGIIAVSGLALLLGILAVARGHIERLRIYDTKKIRFSGLKLAFMLLIIAIFAQLGEAGLQLLKGLRYPWYGGFENYLYFAAMFACAGVWIAIQLTKTWEFSCDPYVYLLRAATLSILFVLFLLLINPRFSALSCFNITWFESDCFSTNNPIEGSGSAHSPSTHVLFDV